MPGLIFEDRPNGLVIRSHEDVSARMVDLTASTVWGSGGTRYQIRDAEAKLRLLAGSDFITLERGGRVIGFYVLRGKRATVGDSVLRAYYRTFLTLAPEYRRLGYGTLLVQQIRRHYMAKLDGSGLIYGYIEADNLHSLAAAKRAGYRSIATFHTTIFSRARPRSDGRCRILSPAESRSMEARLMDLYRDHVLLDFDQSLDPARYWVLEQEGDIVAGAQVEACDWYVRRLPGLSGALLVHGVSRTPVLRRLFNARRCRFVKLGSLYTRPGQESLLFPLMESILACHKVKAAMIFQDPRSPVFRRMAASGRFGVLNAAIDAKVHIMAVQVGLSQKQNQHLQDKPVVISPGDIG